MSATRTRNPNRLPFARRQLRRAALVAALVACGCANGDPAFFPYAMDGNAFTEQDLRLALDAWGDRFGAIVSAVSLDIAEQTDARIVRRRALAWRLRLVPLAREAANAEDPQDAYVSSLTVAVAQRMYFTTGDGGALFGDLQSTAIGAARALEAEVLAIGERFLTTDQMDDLREATEKLVAEHPIRGVDFATQEVRIGLTEVERSSAFDWILDLPMLQYRAFGGVEAAANAVARFNETAQAFNELLAALPQENRWQLELLLYDLEDRESVVGALASIRKLGDSAERAAAAVDRMPEDLRAAIADGSAEMQSVRTLVAEARAVVREAQALVAATLPVVDGARDTAVRVETIAASVEGMRGSARDGGRPFDVREWESAAKEIGVAAAELRATIAELGALTGSDAGADVEARIDALVDLADGRARSTVDHAALRAAQLLVAAFALAVVYRVIAVRLGRRDGG